MEWNAADPAGKYLLLLGRSGAITTGVKLSCQSDFKATTTTNVYPIPPIVVPLKGPPRVSLVGTKENWIDFIATPPPPQFTYSIHDVIAVGKGEGFTGNLICEDSHYQAPNSPDKNPFRMYDYQTLRSYKGQYSLSIESKALVVRRTATNEVLWNGPVATSSSQLPLLRTALEIHRDEIVVVLADSKDVLSAITPSKVPRILESDPPLNLERISKRGEFDRRPGPPELWVYWHERMYPVPDPNPYRRLELTDDGVLQFLDITGKVLWANSAYNPADTEEMRMAIMHRVIG
jgi:hypothetical protein